MLAHYFAILFTEKIGLATSTAGESFRIHCMKLNLTCLLAVALAPLAILHADSLEPKALFVEMARNVLTHVRLGRARIVKRTE